MANKIARRSRKNGNWPTSTGILPVWRAGVLACSELFMCRGSAGKMPAGPTAKMAVLRHLRHAVPV